MKRSPVLRNFQAIAKSRHWQRKDTFEAGELKENHAEMQNTLMEEKDNKFRSLEGSNTALLSYHSHRGYFKTSNCENCAVF